MNRAAGGPTTESAVGILKDAFIPRNSRLKITDVVMHYLMSPWPPLWMGYRPSVYLLWPQGKLMSPLFPLLVNTVKYLALLLLSYQTKRCAGISMPFSSKGFAECNVGLLQDYPCYAFHQGHFLPSLFCWCREESEAFKMLLISWLTSCSVLLGR